MISYQQNKVNAEDRNDLSTVKSSKKKIGIMGPFGFGNLGDAATQQAMLQNIQKYCPEAEIIGFSLNPEDTQERHEIKTYPMGIGSRTWWEGENKSPIFLVLHNFVSRVASFSNPTARKLGKLIRYPFELVLEFFAVIRAFKRIKGLDLFIVSGGGQLDDYWGGTRQNPYSLLLWSILTKLHKTKFAIVSVGAGPIALTLSKVFIRKALALANYRSYRDEDSHKYIEKVLGFKRNDPVYPDLAHSLDLLPYQATSSSPQPRSVIGIGPMSYYDPRVWPENDRSIYLSYLTKLATFVSWLLQEQYTVLLFVGEADHDRHVIRDLREIIDQAGISYSAEQIIEEPIETVDDLMSQLVATDLVIASRFHGVLLSQLVNKPVLALSYHAKIDMLMADTGQSEYCLSIDDFDVDTLKEKFIALEANQEIIKSQLAKRVQEYRDALDKQYKYLFNNL